MKKKKYFDEQAFNRSKAIKRIENHSENIGVHLAKIFIVNSDRDINHWKGEIKDWLSTVRSNLNVKQGRLNLDDLKDFFENIWLEACYFVSDVRHNKDYKDFPQITKDPNIIVQVKEHFMSVFYKEYSREFFDRIRKSKDQCQDVTDWICDLILEYKNKVKETL